VNLASHWRGHFLLFEGRPAPAYPAAAGCLLFTFGPLHFYHLSRPSPWPMMAGIFAIGLFFGVLYHRSRNLWLAATFHGVGTAWILTAFPEA
jgi:membrane protease YdiL (CAAX protease family)